MEKVFKKPISPSKLLNKKIYYGYEIIVSHGHVNKTYHANTFNRDGDMYLLNLVDDRDIEINPNFIISIEKIKIVELIIDATAHANYYKITCKESIITQKYAVSLNYSIRFDDKFNNSTINDKIFEDIVTTPLKGD